jgi:hypothetical protein
MEQRTKYLKVKLALGCISLVAGLLAANLALFQWIEPTGLFYLLGDYARYACAYGGFAAMILGAMLINDFLVLKTLTAVEHKKRPLKVNRDYPRSLAKTDWLLAEDLRKSASREKERTVCDFSEKEEERAVIAEAT